jgi:hypothetical protein
MDVSIKNSRYLILILLFFPLTSMFAQSNKVTYHIFDQSTNKPIPFVHIQALIHIYSP